MAGSCFVQRLQVCVDLGAKIVERVTGERATGHPGANAGNY
jgi:hypothetical protein